MGNNSLSNTEKSLRSIAKRYENVKYSVGLAVLFLMKGTSAFSDDNHVQEIEKQKDIAKTFISIFNEQGKLPVWHLVGNETDCMIGNPGIPVLADIVLKGFDVDKKAAYNAMKASAMLDERSLDNLTILELDDLVTVLDVANTLQRFEMVRRISEEITRYLLELGSRGRLVNMQVSELIWDLDEEEE